jgi:hypothetical protein
MGVDEQMASRCEIGVEKVNPEASTPLDLRYSRLVNLGGVMVDERIPMGVEIPRRRQPRLRGDGDVDDEGR